MGAHGWRSGSCRNPLKSRKSGSGLKYKPPCQPSDSSLTLRKSRKSGSRKSGSGLTRKSGSGLKFEPLRVCDPEVTLPLSSGVTNPIGCLGGSGGDLRTRGIKPCGQFLPISPSVSRATAAETMAMLRGNLGQVFNLNPNESVARRSSAPLPQA